MNKFYVYFILSLFIAHSCLLNICNGGRILDLIGKLFQKGNVEETPLSPSPSQLSVEETGNLCKKLYYRIKKDIESLMDRENDRLRTIDETFSERLAYLEAANNIFFSFNLEGYYKKIEQQILAACNKDTELDPNIKELLKYLFLIIAVSKENSRITSYNSVLSRPIAELTDMNDLIKKYMSETTTSLEESVSRILSNKFLLETKYIQEFVMYLGFIAANEIRHRILQFSPYYNEKEYEKKSKNLFANLKKNFGKPNNHLHEETYEIIVSAFEDALLRLEDPKLIADNERPNEESATTSKWQQFVNWIKRLIKRIIDSVKY